MSSDEFRAGPVNPAPVEQGRVLRTPEDCDDLVKDVEYAQGQADAALEMVKRWKARWDAAEADRDTARAELAEARAENARLREALEEVDRLLTAPGLRPDRDRVDAIKTARAALEGE